jgi:putative glutamine amidotransferase
MTPARPLVVLAAASEQVDGVPYLAVREVYVRALEQVAGCEVVIAGGPAAGLADLIDRFDGVVFGGHQSDVSASRYGGAHVGPADRARDEIALTVLPAALRAGLPVLGICRGLQELNVALGGTLRDLPADNHREDETLPRDQQYLPAHDVRLTEGGLLHTVLGTEVVTVNSLHHQAIDRLAPKLRTEATSPDGVIEAVSLRRNGDTTPADPFCLAVQWHPEWYAATDPTSAAIFSGFGTAARFATQRR